MTQNISVPNKQGLYFLSHIEQHRASQEKVLSDTVQKALKWFHKISHSVYLNPPDTSNRQCYENHCLSRFFSILYLVIVVEEDNLKFQQFNLKVTTVYYVKNPREVRLVLTVFSYDNGLSKHFIVGKGKNFWRESLEQNI